MNNLEWLLEIVQRAVFDWRKLITAKAWKCHHLNRIENSDRLPNVLCNFDELRRFFKSDWCELILECNQTSVSALKILSILEEELKDAIEKDEARTMLYE